MNLREQLRNEWSQYIRPLIIKDKCEVCGTEEDLHLHYTDEFCNLLTETLAELQLQELDIELYSKEELNLISHIMLSKQIRCEYKTLCRECHKEEHIINGKVIFNKQQIIDKEKKVKERELYNQNVLKPYLDSILGQVMLQVKDRKELIERIDVKSNGKLLKKISNLNSALEERGISYRIVEFSTSKMVDGKKKNFPNAWRIEKLIN